MGKIKKDEPLLSYRDEKNDLVFGVFQDSGLNLLIAPAGNGKTKYLTHVMVQLLSLMAIDNSKWTSHKILYVDTERPRSQYAFSVNHIFSNTKMPLGPFAEKFHLISANDLKPAGIIESLNEFFAVHRGQKFVIFIDHILPLVEDMNNTVESTNLELLVKRLLSDGHLVIASIHNPYGNLSKGIGHIGSSLQRLASNAVEIVNQDTGDGFKLKQNKSRISALSGKELLLFMDSEGYIDLGIPLEIRDGPAKSPKDANAQDEAQLEEDIKGIVGTFSRCYDKGKKTLLSIIASVRGFSPTSSSSNSFYKKHLAIYIDFSEDGGNGKVTPEGKTLLENELD
jgi:hypothetical protein